MAVPADDPVPLLEVAAVPDGLVVDIVDVAITSLFIQNFRIPDVRFGPAAFFFNSK